MQRGDPEPLRISPPPNTRLEWSKRLAPRGTLFYRNAPFTVW
jgi:hypothetical protein